MKHLLIIICLALIGVLPVYGQRQLSGTVSRVMDGDTYKVSNSRVDETVRILGIDAPELRQVGGIASRDALAAFILKRHVRALWRKRDAFGRPVGRLIFGRRDIGLEMIRAGHAWFYQEFSRDLTDRQRVRYAAAQLSARNSHRGLWKEASPVAPWDYRRGQVKVGN